MKKVFFFIMRARGTREAYKEKRRKKFVGQRLGVTPKSWLTDTLNLFTHFQVFLIIFDHANACKSMQSLAEIHNKEGFAWIDGLSLIIQVFGAKSKRYEQQTSLVD